MICDSRTEEMGQGHDGKYYFPNLKRSNVEWLSEFTMQSAVL